MMIVIGLAIGGGIWYMTMSNQAGLQEETQEATNEAQDAADAYKAKQAEMMKQLEQ